VNTAIRNCIFAFRCDKTWDELEETNSKKIRFCGDCQREVHFCRTNKELKDAIVKNHCVTVVIDDGIQEIRILTGSVPWSDGSIPGD